ncbi:hypothetical protein J2W91_004477 [Paenibacillus amylolyticus]|uniref:Uncharacterized protein n=1 Tax=Paenibacillus amylolyticus TaxID=1451 RepID=A0AAP5H525_PAEAM|nr:hypothetical protein [Paenibacillus amylolyticus]
MRINLWHFTLLSPNDMNIRIGVNDPFYMPTHLVMNSMNVETSHIIW